MAWQWPVLFNDPPIFANEHEEEEQEDTQHLQYKLYRRRARDQLSADRVYTMYDDTIIRRKDTAKPL